MTVESFWQSFLNDMRLPDSTRYYDCYHFDLNEKSANHLLALVLEGRKRATCSSAASFAAEGIRMPRVGDLCVITDWDGNPNCVTETTRVTNLLFKDMTYDICSREGEDDTLESWREGHRRFFTAEGAELGYEFSEDMPVVFEDFRVVYRISDNGGCDSAPD